MEISLSQIRANRVGMKQELKKGWRDGQEGKHQIIQREQDGNSKVNKETCQGWYTDVYNR